MPNSDNSKYSEPSVAADSKNLAVLDESDVKEDEGVEKPVFKPRRKQRWPIALGVILLIAGSGLGWYWWQQNHANNTQANPGAAAGGPPAGQPRAVPVKLTMLETTTLQDSSEFVANLQDPRSVVLKPKIEGRVNQILVKEGDRIRQGQVIVSLESEDLQARLMQAKAAQEAARARLAELQAGSRPEEIAQARAKVAQAQARLRDAQAGARPEEIAQAQSQIDAATADVELARERSNRYRQLSQAGAVSRDVFSGYVREERSAAAKLQEAQRRLEQLRQSRRSDITELTAAVEQEQQNLRQLEKGPRSEEIDQAQAQVAQAQAEIRVAEVQLQDTKVLAPFAGIVGDIPVKIGDYVGKGNDLTTITKNDLLELNLSIPLSQSAKLQIGLPVEILDAQGKVIATSKVNFISPNVNPNTQAVLIKANFPNNSGDLLNRQFIRARIIWDNRPGILIPVTAITRLGGETFVFVAENNPQSPAGTPALVARQKPIKLGSIQGNNYQVLEGLQAGEQIVTSGILNLTDGTPITTVDEPVK